MKTSSLLHRMKAWLTAPVVFRRRNSRSRSASASGSGPEARTEPSQRSAAAIVLHVSWLAIILGLAIEILLLATSAVFGHIPRINPSIVDAAQRVTWSAIVCASISIATVASKLPVSFTGFAGMLSASVAFKIARAVQKGVGAALGVAPSLATGPSPLVLGAIKAVEYGVLAAAIAWMTKRGKTSAVTHAAVGLSTGCLFGAAVLFYTYSMNSQLFTAADIVSRGVNEIFFPVGCSMVLFATEVWAKEWKPAREMKLA